MNPLWAKAPLVLFRSGFRGLLAALVLGAFLLALAAASSPLFVSSQTSRLLASQIDKSAVTRFGAGVMYESSGLGFSWRAAGDKGEPLYRRQNEQFAQRVAKSPYLGSAIFTLVGPEVSITGPDKSVRDEPGRVLARTGALANVTRVAGNDGDGVWITDVVARHLGAGPGDTLNLRPSSGGKVVTVEVDGLYRALDQQPRTGYWRSNSREIYRLCLECPPPPPPILADYELVVALSREMGIPRATFRHEAPLASGHELTLQEAREIETFAAEFRRDMLGEGIAGVLKCCHRGVTEVRYDSSFITTMPTIVDEVERRAAAIEGPVELLFIAGAIVAIGVVSGAGFLGLSARKVEAGLLYVRGMSPTTIATKACLESLIPCVVGGILGLAIALGLVRALGPRAPFDSAAVTSSFQAAATTIPLAVVLLGLVSAFAFVLRAEHQGVRLSRLPRVPWDVALVGLGLLLLGELRGGGALVEDESLGVARPSAQLLLFPVVFIAGWALLTARLVVYGVRFLRARSNRWGHPAYLAAHRLAGSAGVTLLLVSSAAICLGIFVSAQTVVKSLRTTVDAKAKIFVGSDVQATFEFNLTPPDEFPMPLTKATRLLNAGTIGSGDQTFDLLTIDPKTFSSAAFWHRRFGASSLNKLVAKLRSHRGDRVPTIVSAADIPTRTSLSIGSNRVPIEVTAEVVTFPGTSSDRPLVVADTRTMERAFKVGAPLESIAATTEFWIKGPPDSAKIALASFPYTPSSVLTAERVKDVPFVNAAIGTFNVLNVLGIATGLLVVGVTLMYLAARHRSQLVIYALSRRMGLSEKGYRRAVVFELFSMLLTAFCVGVVLALIAGMVVSESLDPLARIPPGPLFAVPWKTLPATIAVLLAACVLGGRVTGYLSRKANFGELMRLAD